MIRPYARPPKPRPVGVLGHDRRVTLENGRRVNLPDVPERTAIFADRDLVRHRFLIRGDGSAYAWNEVPVRWLASGRQVILVGGYPGQGDDFLGGLVALRDFLAARGAGIGSAGSSSWSLLRATLVDAIWTRSGDPPPLPEVIGGRQQSFVPAGHYGAFELWDMSHAYARTLGELCWPVGSWRRYLDPGTPDGTPVFVHARIVTPDGLVPPVPERRDEPEAEPLRRRLDDRAYPVDVAGVWTDLEVAAAREVGCAVVIREAWRMVGVPATPFEAWYAAVREARALGGFAGRLAKIMGNALWGRFCMTGERVEVRYVDGHPITTPAPVFTPPAESQPFDIAETITGRVRSRLYAELIAPAADRLIGVHTDGGLLRPGRELALGADWRRKVVGSDLTYIGPQTYSYRTKGGKVRYVVSGVRPDREREVFAAIVGQTLRGGA